MSDVPQTVALELWLIRGLLVNRRRVCLAGRTLMWATQLARESFRILPRSRSWPAPASVSFFVPPFNAVSLRVPLSVFCIRQSHRCVCARVRRVVLDVVRTFADWHLVEITRSKPSSVLLSELRQVQFTSIGTKRMQKWIGRHERVTN